MKQKYKSDAFEAAHTTASALFRVGGLDKKTMREFDESCLVKPFKPTEIKRLREKFDVSQRTFARYLNTSPSTVEKWETGAKKPSGMGLVLLTLVDNHGLAIFTSSSTAKAQRTGG
jgi:putative transcriptional regulator